MKSLNTYQVGMLLNVLNDGDVFNLPKYVNLGHPQKTKKSSN